jgi:ketosteroid isomerase-like protein
VANDVFAPVPENFEQFSADVEEWIDAANYLAVVGRFRGSAKSGVAVNVPFVHLWTMREGKAASFENVVDRDLWTQAWGG